MSTPWQLQQAIFTLKTGAHRLAQEDPDLTVSVAEDLPEELAAVQNAVIAVARQAREARAMAEAAKAMADETAGRAARFMRRHDAMRGVLLAALDALGTRKIEGPDVTVSLRAGRSETVITDEAQIPDAYWRTVRTLDKVALREDLKQGVVVDGAELANGLPSVTIRGN